MEITTERLKELHKLQEVYVPQLFVSAESIKSKKILNLMPLSVYKPRRNSKKIK